MTREQTPLEKLLEHEIYSLKFVILVDGGCGYHQVCLTPEHYKLVSDAIIIGMDSVVTARYKDLAEQQPDHILPAMEKHFDPSQFEGVPTTYTQEEIDNRIIDPEHE